MDHYRACLIDNEDYAPCETYADEIKSLQPRLEIQNKQLSSINEANLSRIKKKQLLNDTRENLKRFNHTVLQEFQKKQIHLPNSLKKAIHSYAQSLKQQGNKKPEENLDKLDIIYNELNQILNASVSNNTSASSNVENNNSSQNDSETETETKDDTTFGLNNSTQTITVAAGSKNSPNSESRLYAQTIIQIFKVHFPYTASPNLLKTEIKALKREIATLNKQIAKFQKTNKSSVFVDKVGGSVKALAGGMDQIAQIAKECPSAALQVSTIVTGVLSLASQAVMPFNFQAGNITHSMVDIMNASVSMYESMKSIKTNSVLMGQQASTFLCALAQTSEVYCEIQSEYLSKKRQHDLSLVDPLFKCVLKLDESIDKIKSLEDLLIKPIGNQSSLIFDTLAKTRDAIKSRQQAAKALKFFANDNINLARQIKNKEYDHEKKMFDKAINKNTDEIKKLTEFSKILDKIVELDSDQPQPENIISFIFQDTGLATPSQCPKSLNETHQKKISESNKKEIQVLEETIKKLENDRKNVPKKFMIESTKIQKQNELDDINKILEKIKEEITACPKKDSNCTTSLVERNHILEQRKIILIEEIQNLTSGEEVTNQTQDRTKEIDAEIEKIDKEIEKQQTQLNQLRINNQEVGILLGSDNAKKIKFIEQKLDECYGRESLLDTSLAKAITDNTSLRMELRKINPVLEMPKAMLVQPIHSVLAKDVTRQYSDLNKTLEEYKEMPEEYASSKDQAFTNTQKLGDILYQSFEEDGIILLLKRYEKKSKDDPFKNVMKERICKHVLQICNKKIRENKKFIKQFNKTCKPFKKLLQKPCEETMCEGYEAYKKLKNKDNIEAILKIPNNTEETPEETSEDANE